MVAVKEEGCVRVGPGLRIRQNGQSEVERALIKLPVVAGPRDGPSDPHRLQERLNRGWPCVDSRIR